MSGHGKPATYSHGCRCSLCTAAGMQHRRRGLPAGDHRHGTVNGYGNLGCRCQACRDANAKAVARQKAERAARGLSPGDHRHGTSNGYCNWSCRCAACTQAATRDSRTTNDRRRQRTGAA